MLYAVTVALLLSVGAWALESARSRAGLPLRWVWAAAMLGSVAAPGAVWLAERLRPAPLPALSVGGGVELHPLLLAASSVAVPSPTLQERLLTAWMVLSVLLLVALGAGVWLLARRAAGWGRAVVEGEPVRIAPDTGPAVVGLLRPEVVLPAWALAVDSAERALMLRHEQEHLRARDPQLLLGALLLVVAVPWNPVLWWQLRRLRQAVEMDCDARVLQRAPDVRRYGRVLLEVGERARRSPLVVASLSHPTSLLERRIRRMTSQPKGHTRLWSAAGAALAALCVAAACETPRPTGAITAPEAPEAIKTIATRLGAVPLDQVPGYRPSFLNAVTVMRAMERGYPPAQRDQEAHLLVRFVIDAEGVPQGMHVIKGAEISEFDAVAVQAMQQARFNAPPRPVIATMPIVFYPPTRESAPGSAMQAGDHVVYAGTDKSRGAADTPEMVRMRELFKKHKGDKGQARISVRPDGSVGDITILRSSGDPAVDAAFIAGFRSNPFRAKVSEKGFTLTTPIVPSYADEP
jgi:TonB family protein